jgi:hypothetical protein
VVNIESINNPPLIKIPHRSSVVEVERDPIGRIRRLNQISRVISGIGLIVPIFLLLSTSAFAKSDNVGFCSGRMRQLQLQGRGQCKFPSGNQFEGEFVADRRDGKGTFTYKDGTRCEGQFTNDQLTGFGRCTYKTGDRYEGLFQNNQRQGVGKFFYADGTICEGRFDRDALNGVGRCTFPNGNRYEGGFVNNLRQGRGVFLYEDGSRCEAPFDRNAMNGFGICLLSNGDRYEGNIRDNQWHGNGTYFPARSNSISGTWEKGKFLSPGRPTGNLPTGNLPAIRPKRRNPGRNPSPILTNPSPAAPGGLLPVPPAPIPVR